MESFSHCAIKRSLQPNVHGFGFVIWKRNSIHSRNWFKTTKYQKFCYLLSCTAPTSCLILSCTAPTLPFWGIFHYIKHLPIVCWRFQKCLLSVLERYTSYREYSYSKRTEERQGPTPGVRLIESIVTVKGLKNRRDQYQVSVVLQRVDCISWSYSWNMLLQLLSLYATFNSFIYYYLLNSCPTCVTNV